MVAAVVVVARPGILDPEGAISAVELVLDVAPVPRLGLSIEAAQRKAGAVDLGLRDGRAAVAHDGVIRGDVARQDDLARGVAHGGSGVADGSDDVMDGGHGGDLRPYIRGLAVPRRDGWHGCTLYRP